MIMYICMCVCVCMYVSLSLSIYIYICIMEWSPCSIPPFPFRQANNTIHCWADLHAGVVRSFLIVVVMY